MKRSNGHLILLLIAFAATLLTAGIYFYMYNMIGSATARISVDRNKIKAHDVDASRKKGLEQAYKSTVADWAKLEGFFIPSDHMVAFIESLEALGPQTGSTVAVDSVDSDITGNSAPGTTGTIHASVSANGTWSSVMRALSLAEAMPYKVAISGVRLAGSPSAAPSTKGGKGPSSAWRLSFAIEAEVMVPMTPVPSSGSSSSSTSTSASKPAKII